MHVLTLEPEKLKEFASNYCYLEPFPRHNNNNNNSNNNN